MIRKARTDRKIIWANGARTADIDNKDSGKHRIFTAVRYGAGRQEAAYIPHSIDGGPSELRGNSLIVASRFGAEQSDKLRACGDIRPRRANLAYGVLTPTKQADWRRVAE